MLKTVIPGTLYKYRDTSEYHMKALRDDYLYFPYRKQVNDPYDIPIHFVDEQNLFFDGEHTLSPNNSFSDIGIFSLAKNPNCPLMWAHYANCHNGYCIEINTNKMESSIVDKNPYFELNTLTRVNYYKTPPKPIMVPGPFDPKEIIKRLYWKDQRWKYEEEYRWIGFSNEYDFDQKLFYDTTCISKLIFGFNLEKKIEKKLISICDIKGFQWEKTTYDPSKYIVE